VYKKKFDLLDIRNLFSAKSGEDQALRDHPSKLKKLGHVKGAKRDLIHRILQKDKIRHKPCGTVVAGEKDKGTE